ncbi:hypothetical protein AYO20_08909 [Fonsecaea nubica]|uniref:Heterokaryon incompatibility domain-containing protein n=1 Tax=Fonsecaea nubica TaxID=856822 RepID=A0A178CLA3_9EURO|nr:hypothetical protein AYO20_08909 [Fonsecaea nubica]OAL30106.1 hypothetical protein AYO20_08909 [Fonsecaea nubica]
MSGSLSLCKKCHGTLSLLKLSAVTTPHHASAGDLLAAADRGCPVCKTVVQRLLDLFGSKDLPTEIPTKDADNQPTRGYTYSILSASYVDDGGEYFNGRQWLYEFEIRSPAVLLVRPDDRRCVVLELSFGRVNAFSSLPPSIRHHNTGSEACVARMVQWLQDCLQHHPKCQARESAAPWYPTRLVDVGRENDRVVKLVISKSAQLKGPYVTLSHKWGHGPRFALTASLLQDFQTGIALDRLPKTFREAVVLTRCLGMRYLWIDSLCIIQASEDDWNFESLQMEKVYSNCRLNIAATASLDTGGGLFRTRQADKCWPCFGFFSTGLVSRKRWLLRENDVLEKEIEQAPLNYRAWVLQERLLAPRVLHFGKSQLFWQCDTLDACESFPKGLPVAWGSSNPIGKSLDPARFAERERDAALNGVVNRRLEERDIYHVWNAIVQQYTKCGITEPKDKLVAIAGIAKRIASTTGDEYLAGLWRSRITESLLWRADGSVSCRLQQYRAPSWSWASIEGNISHVLDEFIESAEKVDLLKERVKEARVNPKVDGDVFGQVDSGYIAFSDVTLLEPVELRATAKSVAIHGMSEDYLRCDLHTDLPCEPVVKNLSLLPAFIAWGGSLICLILKPSTQAGANVYGRFGVVVFGGMGNAAYVEEHGYLRRHLNPDAPPRAVITSITLV